MEMNAYHCAHYQKGSTGDLELQVSSSQLTGALMVLDPSVCDYVILKRIVPERFGPRRERTRQGFDLVALHAFNERWQ